MDWLLERSVGRGMNGITGIKHWALSRTSLQVFVSVGMMFNVWNHLST